MRMRIGSIILCGLVAAACGGSGSELRFGAGGVEIGIEIQSDAEPAEAFTATGDGFCTEGSVSRVQSDFGEESFFFETALTCTDQSGSVNLRVEGDAPEDPETATETIGTWTVLSGTGVYSDLTGAGDYLFTFEPCCAETYTGSLTGP